MDKDFWKAFLRFLDQATPEELTEKIADIELMLQNNIPAAVKSDAKRMIRLMDQELFVRLMAMKRKK